jgi:hypothetical protein
MIGRHRIEGPLPQRERRCEPEVRIRRTEYARQGFADAPANAFGVLKPMLFSGANRDVLNYYARDDIELIHQKGIDTSDLKDFDYGIVPSMMNFDLNNLQFAETVFQVERDNAVLVVIRKIE